MASKIEALLHLQTIERQMAHLRQRLRSRQNAVKAQQRRMEQLQGDHDALSERILDKRKHADRLDLELRSREEEVSKLRGNLNIARTNKEYATILTQINTLKADNSKFEEEALRVMQEIDTVKAEADAIQEQIEKEQSLLEEVRQTSEQEVQKLTVLMEDLATQRAEAVQAVPPDALATFERIAANYDGDAMASIDPHGKKPPYDYVCGGCYMSLNAEHANALRTRDEVRTCDNCGRILYLEPQAEQSHTE